MEELGDFDGDGLGLGLDDGTKDVVTLHDGTTLTIHGPQRCSGPNCCFHNPSDHPLNDRPLTWTPMFNLMSRVCEHDEPHPDPDSLDYLMRRGLQEIVLVEAITSTHMSYCCEQQCCSPTPSTSA